MRRFSPKKPGKKATLEKVRRLFVDAEQAFEKDRELAGRHVRKAVRASKKARLPLPSVLKKRFCRHCGAFWMPSKTVRVRLRNRKVVYSCLVCKRHLRHPYVREKKAKRSSK